MEIIWLTENYPPNRGGMAQSCERIVRNLRKAGITIHLIHFLGSDYYPVQRIETQGSYTSFPASDSPALTLHTLYHFLEQHFPQSTAILAFGGYLPCLGLIPLASWLHLPAWVAFRGNDFDQAVFSFNRQSSLITLIEKADKILTVTTEKKKKVEAWLPQMPNKVYFTPNGIDIEDWKPNFFDLQQLAQLTERKEKVRIGCIGQLKEKKGAKFWIEALERSGIRPQVEMMWIGEIEESLKSKVLDTDLCFPFLDRTELLPYYLSCDFVAIPSFYDGMPNVLLEAMALQIPCIAARTGGMADVIIDKENGFLFPATDINEAAQCIFYAVTHAKNAPSLGKKAAEHIQKKFTSTSETAIWIQSLQD